MAAILEVGKAESLVIDGVKWPPGSRRLGTNHMT